MTSHTKSKIPYWKCYGHHCSGVPLVWNQSRCQRQCIFDFSSQQSTCHRTLLLHTACLQWVFLTRLPPAVQPTWCHKEVKCWPPPPKQVSHHLEIFTDSQCSLSFIGNFLLNSLSIVAKNLDHSHKLYLSVFSCFFLWTPPFSVPPTLHINSTFECPHNCLHKLFHCRPPATTPPPHKFSHKLYLLVYHHHPKCSLKLYLSLFPTLFT